MKGLFILCVCEIYSDDESNVLLFIYILGYPGTIYLPFEINLLVTEELA